MRDRDSRAATGSHSQPQVRLMSINPLHDLSRLDVNELYAVYLAIARADHQWRARAMYGEATPPRGHSIFRPLSREQFAGRLTAAQRMAGGESMLRQRLSRQAAAYGVDIEKVLIGERQAA